jgi:hypothetical protein
MIVLTGLRKRTDRHGRVYLVGRLGGAKVLIFPANGGPATVPGADAVLCLDQAERTPAPPQRQNGQRSLFAEVEP